ncbi:MAG: hypothetical protein H8E66_02920 [Planctomycetes bacterium]|nr:hypothetical protein [Planctomycetota bacterium]
MNISTILLFLFGDRDAILQIASDGWSLVIGACFVVSAGIARNDARKDLFRDVWVLLLPFAASVVSSLGLFAFVYLLAWCHSAPKSHFASSYVAFLGLYWMTAPLAWIYAIPVEEFLDKGMLDPQPEMTAERLEALDALQRLAPTKGSLR